MLKIILSIVMLLICMWGRAQRINDVSAYYEHVYKAERCIVKDSIAGSVPEYQKAFTYCEIPFCIDLYNALVANVMCRNFDAAAKLAEQLVLKGAELGFFDKHVFRTFKQSNAWKNLCLNYDEIKKRRNIDQALVAELEKMIERDQKVHCSLAEHSNDEAFKMNMSDLNDSLSKDLNTLLLDNHYLDEETIGVQFLDTTFSTNPLYRVLMFHEFQRKGRRLDSIVQVMVSAGKLRSETGLESVEMGIRNIIFTSDYNIYKGKLYQSDLGDVNSVRYKLSQKYIKRLLYKTTDPEVLAIRKDYFMDDPDNVINKVKFVFCHPESDFAINVSLSETVSLAMKEEDYLQSLKHVDCEFINP